MAEELGVSRQTVSRWLNEHGQPRVGYLKLWAMRTGVPLGWLQSGGPEDAFYGPQVIAA
jgi:transcriptional regulator with XRE-family HTH domain